MVSLHAYSKCPMSHSNCLWCSWEHFVFLILESREFIVMCYYFPIVANSMKEYEEKAVSLALNRPKLQALTNKLKAVRMTCPLFDTARWVSEL